MSCRDCVLLAEHTCVTASHGAEPRQADCAQTMSQAEDCMPAGPMTDLPLLNSSLASSMPPQHNLKNGSLDHRAMACHLRPPASLSLPPQGWWLSISVLCPCLLLKVSTTSPHPGAALQMTCPDAVTEADHLRYHASFGLSTWCKIPLKMSSPASMNKVDDPGHHACSVWHGQLCSCVGLNNGTCLKLDCVCRPQLVLQCSQKRGPS